MNRPSPTPARIIVAEDEAQLRDALVAMLAGHGFEVVGVANTGAEAVALVAAVEPELVLMDYRMPEMDGVAAAEAIKDRNPRTSVVMFTAYDETSLSRDATRAGVSAFLVKGCAPSLILEALASALRRRGVNAGAATAGD